MNNINNIIAMIGKATKKKNQRIARRINPPKMISISYFILSIFPPYTNSVFK